MTTGLRPTAQSPAKRSSHGWVDGSGRGVASPSVRPSAHLIASKYICAMSRLSHVLAASWPNEE